MIALNEAGSAPGHDGLSVSQFHQYCQTMQSLRPSTMTTLSTHDTKRSDDVRARLAVITEVPGEWRRFLRRWTRQNAQLNTSNFPDRNTEYFLYQTMIGAWPIEPDRLHAYMEKAVREAKQRTTWGKPIASRQAIQWMLADSEVELEAARLLVYRAGWMADAKQKIRNEAFIAKLYATEMAQRVTDRCIQIFGGLG